MQSSNRILFLTIGHELIHVYHHRSGLSLGDYSENAAYQWTIDAIDVNDWSSLRSYYLENGLNKYPLSNPAHDYAGAGVPLLFTGN